MPRSRTTSKAWHVRDFSAHSAPVEKSAATRWMEQSGQRFPIRRDRGSGMKVGIKRALGTILVGILGGAFGGFVVMLTFLTSTLTSGLAHSQSALCSELLWPFG